MTPAFGFSVGDFIATMGMYCTELAPTANLSPDMGLANSHPGLCTKVAKTLQDSGAAIAEYQQVIMEIHGLQNALTRLAALDPTGSNIDHVNAIRRMALACSLPLQDFLSKIEKCEVAMSPFAKAKSFRSAGKKAQYAVFMTDEVKMLRAMISGKVISINLLLATHASETLSRTEGRMSSDQESVLAKLEEAKTDMYTIR
jgi:hypothetical protein